MYSSGIGIGIVPRMSVTSVSVVTATVATGIGATSFTANWNAFSGAQYYLLDVSTSSSFSTFVYQDQVVLAPTTSYVVIGLTSNTTYYYRVRAAVGVDTDAVSFFSRVYAAGGSLTYTEVTATQTLVTDMKTNGIWTPMKAIYPMVGASAAACAQNLKSSSFTGSFSSGWTFASTGVTGNGTSAYFNSGFNPSIEISSAQNFTLGGYQRIQQLREEIMWGNSVGATGTRNELYARQSTGEFFLNLGGGFANVTNSDARGFYLGKNNSTNTLTEGFKNGSSVFSSSIGSSMKNANMWLGGIQVYSGYSAYSSNEFAFAFLGDGQLTSTDVSNYYTAVQTFQTTLNRQVV
jgi:hypothetical protein